MLYYIQYAYTHATHVLDTPKLAIVGVRVVELPVSHQVFVVLQPCAPAHVLDDLVLAAHYLPDANLIHAAVEALGRIRAPTKAILQQERVCAGSDTKGV